MRSSVVLSCLIAGLVIFCLTGKAHAGIPIPCTGEKIVLVQPLTDADKGEPMGLGYLYQGCFSGKWIVYTGSHSQYREGGEALHQIASIRAGGTEVAAPSLFWGMTNAPGSFWVEWLWVAILGLVACTVVTNKLKTGSFAPPSDTATMEPALAGPAVPSPRAPPRAPPRSSAGFGKRR